MTRLNLCLFITLLILFFVWFQNDISPIPDSATTYPTVILPTPSPVFYAPQAIFIPRINLIADVEATDIDDSGRLNLPQDFFKAGWFIGGTKPGESGSLVISGHLDTTSAAPAIFYYIKNLQINDQIIIRDQIGREFNYLVYKKETYPKDQVPLDGVFYKKDGEYLNLITCAGWWDNLIHSYSHRLIIYAKALSQ